MVRVTFEEWDVDDEGSGDYEGYLHVKDAPELLKKTRTLDMPAVPRVGEYVRLLEHNYRVGDVTYVYYPECHDGIEVQVTLVPIGLTPHPDGCSCRECQPGQWTPTHRERWDPRIPYPECLRHPPHPDECRCPECQKLDANE
jgi:hypothetical protein